jgi:hypothetical protein
MSPPPDIDTLSAADLKSLVLELFEKLAESQRTIASLRDEIARLKGGPGRPDIKANVKPSGMEKASEPEPRQPLGKQRRRGGVRAKLTIHEERKLEADAPAARASKAMRASSCRIWWSARTSPTFFGKAGRPRPPRW